MNFNKRSPSRGSPAAHECTSRTRKLKESYRDVQFLDWLVADANILKAGPYASPHHKVVVCYFKSTCLRTGHGNIICATSSSMRRT